MPDRPVWVGNGYRCGMNSVVHLNAPEARRFGLRPCVRRAAGFLVLVAVACGASAQSLPLRQAPIIEPAPAGDWPLAASAPRGSSASPSAQAVVQVFVEGCVLNEGQSTSVVDWALTQGFEALDPLRAGAEDLLDGTAGSVLAMPGTDGQVLLAAAQDGRCLVWAERTNGPQVRSAVQKVVSGLGFKGARIQAVMDRNLNSAGAWRNQSQWRYRRVGGDRDFGLGSATTLSGSGAQLLHFAPMAPAKPPAPDGIPSR
jgi:hypothetical protein